MLVDDEIGNRHTLLGSSLTDTESRTKCHIIGLFLPTPLIPAIATAHSCFCSAFMSLKNVPPIWLVGVDQKQKLKIFQSKGAEP